MNATENNAAAEIKWEKSSNGYRAAIRGGFYFIRKTAEGWTLRWVTATNTGIEIPCKSLKAAKAAAR